MLGEYLEVVPYERLVFSFGWVPTHGAPAIGPGQSRVEITLADDAGETVMALRHSGIPDGIAEIHASGWSRFLPLLAAAADDRGRWCFSRCVVMRIDLEQAKLGS